MKVWVRGLAVLLALTLIWWAGQTIAGETGEVVVVQITAADGSQAETRLWVVDHQDAAWLRAGNPGAGWYQNLLASPGVTVERAGETAEFEAVPDLRQQAVVNGLMADKYGWRESYISFFFPRDDAVPIRLVPN